jgi:hypothetical protein
MFKQQKPIVSLALVLFAASASADTVAYAVTTNYNNFTRQFGTLDLATGAFNQIGPAIPGPLYGLAPAPNGKLLSVSGAGSLDSVNPATFAAQPDTSDNARK